MNILIVEDDPQQAARLKAPFGERCRVAGSLEDAVQSLEASVPDVIILDAMFPLRSGRNQVATFNAERFLDAIDSACQDPSKRPDVILISGDEQSAMHFESLGEWLHCGRLSDVLPKGVGWSFFQAVLGEKVERLKRQRRLRDSLTEAEAAFLSLESCGIVTRDPSMSRVWKRLEMAARSGQNTFIVGEVGVGKEAMIRAVGRMRRRKTVIFQCRASYDYCMPELFGNAKKSFTEVSEKIGVIELAGKGVLGLDEFCLTPEAVQRDLLRLLESETRQYSRLGENVPRYAECMFVFSDNIDPVEAAGRKEGKKLIDALASRVSTLLIEVPPLRERRGDIPLLMARFLAAANDTYKKHVEFANDVYDSFQSGEWRFGNIRSLKQIVEAVVVFADQDRYDIASLTSSMVGREKALLEKELGAHLQRQAFSTQGNTLLPEDPDAKLTFLKTDLYGESPAWRELSTRLEDSLQYDDSVFELLRRAFAEADPNWLAAFAQPREIEARLQALRGRLINRDAKDPATRLYYVSLLYMLLREDHRATRQDLIRILSRAYTQISKLCDPRAPGSLISMVPDFVFAVDEGPRKLLKLGP